MSDQENYRATGEARDAVARSAAPLSRHDLALQRYLTAMQHTSLKEPARETASPARSSTDPSHHQPLLTEIHTTTPTLSTQHPSTQHPESTADRVADHQRTDVVVVGVDGSTHARRAADWAAAEAAQRHATLRLVSAYSLPVAGYAGYSMAPNNLGSVLRAEGRKMLDTVVDEIRVQHPELDIQTRLFQGDAVVALRSESAHARLTVVGSRGNGRVSGVLLGSVAMAVSAHGTAPVAVIPAEGPTWVSRGPVVVGVDGSPTSQAAVAFAFEDAAVRGTTLVAVHTWNEPRPTFADVSGTEFGRLQESERAVLSEQLAGWRERYPDVPVELDVVLGRPTQTLLAYARRAQLLVVGSRGRGGFAGMVLGSTSHALITHAVCPVVVVRPDSMN